MDVNEVKALAAREGWGTPSIGRSMSVPVMPEKTGVSRSRARSLNQANPVPRPARSHL